MVKRGTKGVVKGNIRCQGRDVGVSKGRLRSSKRRRVKECVKREIKGIQGLNFFSSEIKPKE